MALLKNGRLNQVSLSGTLDIKTRTFLDDLLNNKRIKDYTPYVNDLWIEVESEWVPIEFGLKKLGDEIYNEYIKHGRQEA